MDDCSSGAPIDLYSVVGDGTGMYWCDDASKVVKGYAQTNQSAKLSVPGIVKGLEYVLHVVVLDTKGQRYVHVAFWTR